MNRIEAMRTKKGSHPALWVILILGTGLVAILLFQLFLNETQRTGGIGPLNSRVPDGRNPPLIISRIESLDSKGTEEGTVREKEAIDDIEPVSDPYRGIRARLIDAQTGEPITRCTIWYCDESQGAIEDQPMPPGRTQSLRDARGVLRLYGLDEGTYSVAVKAPGYLEFCKKGIQVPQEEDYLLFELSRGTFIEGKVVTLHEEPVPKMTVFLEYELENPEDSPPARRVAETDGRGSFLFGGLPPGRYTLSLKSLTQPLAQAKDIYLPRGGRHFATLILPALPSVEFQIRDPFGHPVVSASIKFYKTDEGDATFILSTDQYGKARCSFVPPGDYNLRIYKSTYLPHVEDFKIFSGSDIIRIERSLAKNP